MKKIETCSVYEIIAGPIAGSYVGSSVSHHILVVIHPRVWYFIVFGTGRYHESSLKRQIKLRGNMNENMSERNRGAWPACTDHLDFHACVTVG